MKVNFRWRWTPVRRQTLAETLLNEQRFAALTRSSRKSRNSCGRMRRRIYKKRYDFLAQLAGKVENRQPKANLLTLLATIKKARIFIRACHLPLNKTILRKPEAT